ncbi:MAG: hypothetical protein HC767_07655 [Akkermansiaceae bacterium]|nr:hypothetical protein [Akkermansiaceae bacterium]
MCAIDFGCAHKICGLGDKHAPFLPMSNLKIKKFSAKADFFELGSPENWQILPKF